MQRQKRGVMGVWGTLHPLNTANCDTLNYLSHIKLILIRESHSHVSFILDNQ